MVQHVRKWCRELANVRTDVTSSYQERKRKQHKFENWLCKNDDSQHFRSRQQHNNAEVVTAVRKWLRSQRPDFYRDGIFKISPKWGQYICVFGDYVEKQG
jgi:hypothetical protein